MIVYRGVDILSVALIYFLAVATVMIVTTLSLVEAVLIVDEGNYFVPLRRQPGRLCDVIVDEGN